MRLTLSALNHAVYNRKPPPGLKAEAFHGNRFDQDEQVVGILRSYLHFYNRDRLHSSLNYLSPTTYEQQIAQIPGVN